MILYYPLMYKELYGTYSKLFKEDWEIKAQLDELVKDIENGSKKGEEVVEQKQRLRFLISISKLRTWLP